MALMTTVLLELSSFFSCRIKALLPRKIRQAEGGLNVECLNATVTSVELRVPTTFPEALATRGDFDRSNYGAAALRALVITAAGTNANGSGQ